MNRVRTGLTGLALVFLIVIIGAANLWPFGNHAPEPEEDTLAKLGVAPSGDSSLPGPSPAQPPAVIVTPPVDEAAPDEPLVIDEAGNLTEI